MFLYWKVLCALKPQVIHIYRPLPIAAVHRVSPRSELKRLKILQIDILQIH